MVEEGVGLDLLVENEEPPGPPEEESWEDFRRQFTQPDHVIDFHGHIIGLALSHDERFWAKQKMIKILSAIYECEI